MARDTAVQVDDLVAVRRAHIWLGFIIALVTPPLAVAATVYNMRQSLSDRISAVQLDTANQFVKRDEFRIVQSKLDTLLGETNELKGMLKTHMSQSPSR